MSGAMPGPRGPMPGRAPVQPPLLDLLGATWTMDAPVVGVAWDGDLACFALGDGSLAMGRAEWEGAPKVSPREGGGIELAPGSSPPPPMARQSVHRGACLTLAADPAGGYVSGGDDGVMARTTPEGVIETLETHPGNWVDLVATGAAGWRVCAVGRRLFISGPEAIVLELPGAATALAFDPSGTSLAAAYYRGVTVWTAEPRATRQFDTKGFPRSITWSPDGQYVFCGLQENALHGWRVADGGDVEMGGYPGQPRSLSFAADGSYLASSGGARVVCWPFDQPEAGEQPVECGMPSSRTPVCRVACHPRHRLIAAGYHNGAVLLCQPGSDDVLFARASAAGAPGTEPGKVPPGSSIAALAWSADGARLAIGTEGGEIGLLALPAQMFRFGSPRDSTDGSSLQQRAATP